MWNQANPRLLQREPMQRCCLGECRAACCLYGVWIGVRQAEELLSKAEWISPYMPAGFEDPALWLDGRREPDEHVPGGEVVHSRVLRDPSHYGGSACVFLRDDHKCALQVASVAAGEHPWRFKPDYCVLHPLDLDEQSRITLDETAALLAEPGSCLRPAEGLISLAETFEPELRYFLGDAAYEALRREADESTAGG
jgi:hypothetical protein